MSLCRFEFLNKHASSGYVDCPHPLHSLGSFSGCHPAARPFQDPCHCEGAQQLRQSQISLYVLLDSPGCHLSIYSTEASAKYVVSTIDVFHQDVHNLMSIVQDLLSISSLGKGTNSANLTFAYQGKTEQEELRAPSSIKMSMTADKFDLGDNW